MNHNLSIRPMTVDEAPLIPKYFHGLSEEQLRGMGIDPPKLPSPEDWNTLLIEDFDRPIESRHFFYVLWIVDEQVAGHSNINKIEFGDHAFAHLHLWNVEDREKGIGTQLFQRSVQQYFERFRLQSIFCEPFADNLAPNHMLPKAGFRLLKTYDTLPGWINYHQTVNRWQLDRPTE